MFLNDWLLSCQIHTANQGVVVCVVYTYTNSTHEHAHLYIYIERDKMGIPEREQSG